MVSNNGHNGLAPAELRRELDELSRGQAEIMAELRRGLLVITSYLDRIKMNQEEILGRSGSLTIGKSSEELIQLYEVMKANHPALTLKDFASQAGVPVDRLYTARKRRPRPVGTRQKSD